VKLKRNSVLFDFIEYVKCFGNSGQSINTARNKKGNTIFMESKLLLHAIVYKTNKQNRKEEKEAVSRAC
jgi:hypothetical protein